MEYQKATSNTSSWFRGLKGKLLFAAVLPVLGFAVLGVVASRGVDRAVF